MAARKLQAVPDEVPPMAPPAESAAPLSVKSAAASSYRDLLVALRDSIAGQIDGGILARDLAALSRRLMEISKELEALDAAEKGDGIGEAADTADEAFDTQ